MDAKTGEENVITAPEAAAIKGVTRQAVYAAIRDGRLPSRQIGEGKVHLIQRSDLDEWHVVKHPKKPRRPKQQPTEGS
jgi:excisionase family DNA binding protein